MNLSKHVKNKILYDRNSQILVSLVHLWNRKGTEQLIFFISYWVVNVHHSSGYPTECGLKCKSASWPLILFHFLSTVKLISQPLSGLLRRTR